jgi:hypothetical protein
MVGTSISTTDAKSCSVPVRLLRIADRHVTSIVRFAATAWAPALALNSCPKELWTKSGRNVLFEVKSNPKTDRTILALILGPSEATLRQYLYDHARAEPTVFVGASNSINQNWTTLYSRELLPTAEAMRLNEEDEKIAAIRRSWDAFLQQDLPRLAASLLRIALTYRQAA